MSTDLNPHLVDGGLHTATAPFDAIRRTTPEGREYFATATTYVLPSGIEFLRKKLATRGFGA